MSDVAAPQSNVARHMPTTGERSFAEPSGMSFSGHSAADAVRKAGNPSVKSGNGWRRALYVLWALVLAWLVSPALTAVNLEAYTARLQSMAVAFNGAGLFDYDRLAPLHVEYLYLTRGGVVLFIAAFNRLFGLVPDLGFRVLTFASFVVLVLASASFARTWGAIRFRLGVPVLLLIPGVSQIAFYYNDNIVSAALGAAALGLTSPKATWRRFTASGALLALAVACRTDAILLAPLLGLLALVPTPWRLRTVLPRWLGTGAGMIAIFAGVRWFGGFTPLDSMAAAKLFQQLPVYASGLKLLNLIAFFSIVMAIVVAIGVVQFGSWCGRRRQYVRLLAFVVAPLGVTMFIASQFGSSLRYGYPLLTPYWALYGGWAVRKGLSDWRAGRRGANAIVALTGAILALTPPVLTFQQEGPQSLTENIWQPIAWRNWQTPIEESGKRVDALIAERAGKSLTVVITTHFNDDAYLRERLIYAGFAQRYAEEVYPGCSGFFVFQKAGETIVDVRSDDVYGVATYFLKPPVPHGETATGLAALPIVRAFSCPAVRSAEATYLTAYEKNEFWLASRLYPASILDRVTSQQILQILPLTPAEISELETRASSIAPTLVAADGSMIDYPRLLSMHETRFLHANPHWP